jgi:hypothetical protein
MSCLDSFDPARPPTCEILALPKFSPPCYWEKIPSRCPIYQPGCSTLVFSLMGSTSLPAQKLSKQTNHYKVHLPCPTRPPCSRVYLSGPVWYAVHLPQAVSTCGEQTADLTCLVSGGQDPAIMHWLGWEIPSSGRTAGWSGDCSEG